MNSSEISPLNATDLSNTQVLSNAQVSQDISREMSSNVKKQISKLRCCSICLTVCGIILIVFAGLVPYLMNNLIVAGAKKAAALT